MIIGFGSTEVENEKLFANRIAGFCAELPATEYDMLSDEDIKSVKDFVKSLDEEYEKSSGEYGGAENFPDRYFRTFSYVLGDSNYVFVKTTFHHINRRHAFSPDGWAMMATVNVFAFTKKGLVTP